MTGNDRGDLETRVRDNADLLGEVIEEVDRIQDADYLVPQAEVYRLLKWTIYEQTGKQNYQKADVYLRRAMQQGKLAGVKGHVKRFTAGSVRNMFRRYLGEGEFEEVSGDEEEIKLGSYLDQEGLEAILDRPKKLAKFDLWEYVEQLGNAVEVSSGEMRVLMTMFDRQQGLKEQFETFYYHRMRTARDVILRGKFVGRMNQNTGATYNYLFPKQQVRAFFFDAYHGYTVLRPKMRQDIGGNHKKGEDAVRFALRTAPLPMDILAGLTGFGTVGGELYLGVIKLKDSDVRTLTVPRLEAEGATITFRYTPQLLVDRAMIQAQLHAVYEEKARDLVLYHLAELSRMGAILPISGSRRTYRLGDVIQFLEKLEQPAPEGKESYRDQVMTGLRERLQQPGAYQESELVMAKQRQNFKIKPEDIDASSIRIQEHVGDTPEIIGTRHAWRVIRTYLESSGRNGGPKGNMYAAFTGDEREEILEELHPLLADESKANRQGMTLPSLLYSLYSHVRKVFILTQEGAIQAVRQHFSARGVDIGRARIRDILLDSKPIELTELVKRVGEQEIDDKISKPTVSINYQPVTETRLLFSPQGIDAALEAKYRGFTSDTTSGGAVIDVVKAGCSKYFDGNVPEAIIDEELRPYKHDGRKKVAGQDWITEDLSLLSRIIVLKHGLVDNMNNMPDIEEVKAEHRAKYNTELDTQRFAISDNNVSELLIRAGKMGMHQEFVQSGALARLNKDLHQRMRVLAGTGEVQSYQVGFDGGSRATNLCFRLTDVLRVAESEQLRSGIDPLTAYQQGRHLGGEQ